MKRVRAVAVSVLACLLVGACGESTPSAPERSTPAPSSLRPAPTGPAPVSPAPVSPAPVSPAPTGPTQPTGSAQRVTVSGTVEEGVEAGCLLLKGYLLIGGREDGVRAGAQVTVTGRPQPDLVSTCQQGTPLRVDTVRPG